MVNVIEWDGGKKIVRPETPEEEAARLATPPEPITPEQVNNERDRRMRGGFEMDVRGETYRFDSDSVSMQRITGAATLAALASAGGMPPGVYTWTADDPMDPSAEPFRWITQDNGTVMLDVVETFALGKKAAEWETAHLFAADMLKRLPEIPQDYTSDTYWP